MRWVAHRAWCYSSGMWMSEVVTPAKAGVQVVYHRRYWIPAFAGMTDASNFIGPIQSPRYRFALLTASAAVSAVRLTMRRTVAVVVITCTGLAAPRRIGPMVMPSPPIILSRL